MEDLIELIETWFVHYNNDFHFILFFFFFPYRFFNRVGNKLGLCSGSEQLTNLGGR